MKSKTGKIYNVWTGTPTYKHVLIRKVGWCECHPRNAKFFIAQNFPLRYYPMFNIQLLIFGVQKMNSCVYFRLFNHHIEIRW
jgi:hypothetical protein